MTLWKLVLLILVFIPILLWLIPSPRCEPGVIAPGLIYQKELRTIPINECIHTLKIDPAFLQIVPILAHDAVGSTESTSSIARRTKALAAINGGMFGYGYSVWNATFLKCAEYFGYNHHRALPLFALKKQGEWYSLSPTPNGFIGWKDGGKLVLSGTITTNWYLKTDTQLFLVYDLNKPLVTVLFTPSYGAMTPYRNDIVDVVIRNDKVCALVEGGGATIPKDGFVYRDLSENIHGKMHEGQSVSLVCEHYIQDSLGAMAIDECEHVIGGMPLLIQQGKITDIVLQTMTPFFTERTARTAIGILPNGQWLWVVVEANSSTSAGMSLPELATFMQQRGCVTALNLDGGSSSAMVIRTTVVTMPTGLRNLLFSHERVVADALVVVPKKI